MNQFDPMSVRYTESNTHRATERDGKKIRSQLGALVAGASVLTAIGTGMYFDNHVPEATHTKPEHTLSYLNSDEMQAGIIVESGETGEDIGQLVNGGNLSGEALKDEGDFINNQGLITETDSSGRTVHSLKVGQLVEAPVMPEQQVTEVNSGKVG